MKPLLGFLVVLAVVLGVGGVLGWRRRATEGPADEAGSATALVPLSLVEGRLVATHPLFVGLLAVSATTSALLYFVLWGDEEIGDDGLVTVVVFVVLGLFGAVLAANRSAGRARRDGTDELLRSLPTAPKTHTGAQLLGAWVPAAVLALVMLAALVAVQVRMGGREVLPGGALALAELVVVAAGAAVVGVLLARWLPLPLAGAAGVVALIVLNNTLDHLHPRWRWLRVAPEPSFGGIFDIRPLRWHLTFLVGLVVLGAGIALARHGLGRLTVALLAVGALVTAATGWVMTRPPSASAVAAKVAMLEDPTEHQHCQVRDGLRYCAYPDYARWVVTWHEAVRGVAAAAPPVAAGPVEVVQRPTLDLDLLDEVDAALDRLRAWPADDDAVHPGLVLSRRWPHVEVAYQAAAATVGLPVTLASARGRCTAAGQARGLVAWWLAAHGGRDVERWLRQRADRASPNEVVAADVIPDYDGPGPYRRQASSVGAAGDIAGALALRALDDATVRGALAEHWPAVLDPATPSSEVLRWMGLEPPAALAAVVRPDLGACA